MKLHSKRSHWDNLLPKDYMYQRKIKTLFFWLFSVCVLRKLPIFFYSIVWCIMDYFFFCELVTFRLFLGFSSFFVILSLCQPIYLLQYYCTYICCVLCVCVCRSPFFIHFFCIGILF